MRSVQCSPVLYLPHRRKQFGGSQRSNRTAANPREDVALESPDDAVAMTRGPGRGILGVPLASNYLETVCRSIRPRRLHGLAVLARVYAIGQQSTGSVALFSSFLQAHVRINAKREQLFLV